MNRRPAPKMAEGWVDLDGEGFELDTVLPGQYLGVSVEWTPEHKLLVAVLVSGIRDYRKGRTEWVDSRSAGYLYDFQNVCHHLNLDPDFVRDLLERERDQA